MMRSAKLFLFSTMLASVGGIAVNAAEPGQSSQLEEIVVTARKVSEKLQITPVAVTAITAQGLERKQIQTVYDLQGSTPNLSTMGGGVGTAAAIYVAIRGAAQNSINSASDSAVGIYVNGVYMGRPMAGNLDMLDVANAEILRGPQGTLFGRNTTGGAVSLNTKAPTSKFAGYVKLGIGNYDQRMVEAMVNTPLSEDFAARSVFRYNEHSGYSKYVATGGPAGDLKGDYYGRISLGWTPSNLPLTLQIVGDYTNYKDSGTPTVVTGINPASAGGLMGFLGLNPSDYLVSDASFRKDYSNPRTGTPIIDELQNFNRAKGLSANLDVELGEMHLKSITAYRESNSGNSLDLDGTPARIGAFYTQYRQRQFSQELQLSGKQGALDWITGLYYFTEKGTEWSRAQFYGILADLGFGAPTESLDFGDFRSSSAAAFAQVNYHFTDKLRATGGFRYTWDDRELVRHGLADVPTNTCSVIKDVPGGPCNESHAAHFSYPAWTAGLDYQAMDNLFLYVKTSGAAMAGGFNTRSVPPGASQSFSPEKVKDIEAGFKADLLDHRLRTNLAVFYAHHKGVQSIANESDPTTGRITQYVKNAGNERAYGVEFEGTALPWEGMEITGSAAYLRAKYVKGTFVNTRLVGGVLTPIDRSDEIFPQAPKYTLSIGATQSVDMPFGRASFHADYSYTSTRAVYQDTPSTPAEAADFAIQNSQGFIKGVGLVNARILVNIDDPDVEIAFWGRNLANVKTYQHLFASYTSLGTSIANPSAPRTYGVTVAYHW